MTSIHFTETDERAYLDHMLQRLDLALQHAENSVQQFSREFRQNEAYLYDQRSSMDDADRVAAGQSFKRMASHGESTNAARKRLVRLLESPYFGRIDFNREGSSDILPIYIGTFSFIDKSPGIYPIYDWRAPVSSMFYDFELGSAWYETPGGTVKGSIDLRRQFKIRRGKMEYMIENAVNIQDDVLQKELSQNSDDKMKSIVATIQRDQNAIIRDETSSVLIIQGVAGSGKTSIAIHRIAFLLYRFRETLTSKDILIISPNRVFADYISNVLPELGESQVPEMGMEELADDLLDHQFKFQTFLQQTFSSLHKNDEAFNERVRFKSSGEFVGQLNRYVVHLENSFLRAGDIQLGRTHIPAAIIQQRFRTLQRIPLLNRLPELTKEIQSHMRSMVQRKLTGNEKMQIHHALSNQMHKSSLIEIYKDFYRWLKQPELFRMFGNDLEYADVFPLIYCKIRLQGVQQYQEVKHLVVDEMQDYTPIQYSVLSRLFPGKKTILGDMSQAIHLHATSAADIQKVFPQAEVVNLFKSYRSTLEITRFTQRIKPNPDLQAIERHGPEPQLKGFDQREEEEEEIRRIIERFRISDRRMFAIICKTPGQAKSLSSNLGTSDIWLMNDESTSFREGVLITTVALAKGLEFDEVVVPQASDENYKTDAERNLLYIACTRAMHQLTLTYTGNRSGFLSGVAAIK